VFSETPEDISLFSLLTHWVH